MQRERPVIAVASSTPAWVGLRPVPLTTLVGREREITSLRALLVRPGVRLVTLTGPGGVGKTRLAVQVASEMDTDFDTRAFVPLAAIRDPALLWVTVVRALACKHLTRQPGKPCALTCRPGRRC